MGGLTVGTSRDDTLEQVLDGRDPKLVLVGTIRSPWSPERLSGITKGRSKFILERGCVGSVGPCKDSRDMGSVLGGNQLDRRTRPVK